MKTSDLPPPKTNSFIAYSYFKDNSSYRFSVVKGLKLLIFDHKHNNTPLPTVSRHLPKTASFNCQFVSSDPPLRFYRSSSHDITE